jgi:hypothetical protein
MSYGPQIAEINITGGSPEATADWLPVVRLASVDVTIESGGKTSTCSFEATVNTVRDGAYSVVPQYRIEILSTNSPQDTIFAGYVSRVEPQVMGPSTIRYRITCQDNTRVLDRVLVASESYTNESDEAILDDLFSTYLPSITTTGVIGTTPPTVLDSVVFENLTLRQCVERICDRTGATWRLGFDDDLKYYRIGAVAGEFDFSDIHGQNLLLYSEALDDDTWLKVNISVSGLKLIESAGSGNHYIYCPISVASGNTYTLTVSAKAGERKWVKLVQYTSYANFNLETGAIGNSAGIVSARIIEEDSGYYAVSMTWVSPYTGPTDFKLGDNNTASWDDSYVGDGASGIYIRRTQLNDGNATPYVATTDAAIYHTADEYILQSDFGYQEEFSTPANTVSVTGYQAAKPNPATIAVNIAVSADDGYVKCTAAGTFPPAKTDAPQENTALDSAVLHCTFEANGEYSQALLAFNTSAIPDDAEIQSAVLQLTMYTIAKESAAVEFGIDAYAASNWPITAASDYTSTQSGGSAAYSPSVFDFQYVADLGLSTSATTPTTKSFAVLNPNTTISKTGYSGFKVFLGVAGTPTGHTNEVLVFMSEHATVKWRPKLTVTYQQPQQPPVTGSFTDAVSVAAYGTFEKSITDAQCRTAGECNDRAEVETVRYGYPRKSINCTFDRYGLSVGDTVHFASSLLGVDDDFVIQRLRLKWPGRSGRPLYYAELGEVRPDLIQFLRVKTQ